MTAVLEDAAVTDPVGLAVRLVAGVEQHLGAEQIREVVISVGSRRPGRRHLAQALRQHPEVLRTGRPPAAFSVARLPLALREAGVQDIAAPRCGECDRQGALSVLPPWWELGLLWLPRQARVLRGLRRAAPGGQQRLAWSVLQRPDLLTGNGHLAPVPAVLRLVDELVAAGTMVVARPACPRCHRVMALSERLEGQRVCRACFARSKAVACSRCGAVREPAPPGTLLARRCAPTAWSATRSTWSAASAADAAAWSRSAPLTDRAAAVAAHGQP